MINFTEENASPGLHPLHSICSNLTKMSFWVSINSLIRVKALIICMSTWIAVGLFNTLDNIATPCSVNAIGEYLLCSPLFEAPVWLLKASYS
jgi:hypothetical protein